MQSKSVTITLAADDADGVCQSQTPGAAGALTINGALASGGVATLDAARRVLFTFAADESARSFVVTGTVRGAVVTETVTGSASYASTAKDFGTVTSITIDDAAAGALTVGTSTVGASKWIPLSANLNPFNASIGCAVTGTVNYSVEHTHDDVQTPTGAFAVFVHESMSGQTENAEGAYSMPVAAVRVKVNSGTGTVVMTVRQAG